ncbi:cyclophilin-like fold protein [Hydrogenophaga sp.]|uniref:cyclophilin-like fold protein n=1 Tax=Hydrogenophaga sp. TaxID=1904254 RepID=UPI00351DAEED
MRSGDHSFAPTAYKPLAANISYYTPWGNLAIFYKEGHLSSGLVRLGRIDSGLDRIRHMSVTVMRIERSQP